MSTDSQRLAIKILSGPDSGAVFLLGRTAFIGRKQHCEIRLNDINISPVHAGIRMRGESYILTDLYRGAGRSCERPRDQVPQA